VKAVPLGFLTFVHTGRGTNMTQPIIYNNIKLAIPERYLTPTLLDRFKRGIYEKDEYALIENLNKNDTVLELGACLGYLSNSIAKRVNKIVSVEANPELSEALLLNKTINESNNLEIESCIIDSIDKDKTFYSYDLVVAGSCDRSDIENPGSNGKLSKTIKKYTVACKTFEDIQTKYGVQFNSLVIDIEGGELKFLQQYAHILPNIRKIIIELHGRFMTIPEFNNKCIKIITDNGLTLQKEANGSYYFTKIE
jgi:FkbM family methyltransferase